MHVFFRSPIQAFALLLCFPVISALSAAEPMGLTLAFTKTGWSPSAKCPSIKWNDGFLMVDVSWVSAYTDKHDVRYQVWIESATTDWASVNTLKTKEVWRQVAYIPGLRESARKSARLRMTFGYRPPGLSSAPIEEGNGKVRYERLPPVPPLKPGNYRFTCVVNRSVAGGPTESGRIDFEVTITGAEEPLFFSGLENGKVFQRKDKAKGDLLFFCSAAKPESVDVTVLSGGKSLLSFHREIAAPNQELSIPDLPIGGPYTVEVKSGEWAKRFSDIWIGDIWIISGQSNAVGTGGDLTMARKPMEGVNGLNPRYTIYQWKTAQDGFFESTVGPWVTAAQMFKAATGVPVGLIGYASGSKPIDYFLDTAQKNAPHLKPIVEQNGRGAGIFFWYQGESDSFDETNCAGYGTKLMSLATAVRQDAKNPGMKVAVVQLAKYLWKKDAHFSPIREAQLQFVKQDANAVIYSTLPYEVNDKDKIHLVTKSYIELGEQIAKSMIAWENTGKLESPGPALEKAFFSSGDRNEITATFRSAKGLFGGENLEEWYITDSAHGGFGNGGFVGIAAVTVDSSNSRVILKLSEPAGQKAELSYGYRADVGGTLKNSENHPAAAFVKAPIADNP